MEYSPKCDSIYTKFYQCKVMYDMWRFLILFKIS